MFATQNYQQGPQRLLAACDEELLGNTYKEGKFRLQVSEKFYDGSRVDQQILETMLRQCTVANLVGERTVGVAQNLGLVEADHVLIVDGIPHAQLLVIDS